MPAEGGGLKRERYELKPTDWKDKDIVLVEEKGINNEGNGVNDPLIPPPPSC